MDNFPKKDVLIMAKAIVASSLTYYDSPVNRGDIKPCYQCNYCSKMLQGYDVGKKDFKHEPYCPVLIAQNILN